MGWRVKEWLHQVIMNTSAQVILVTYKGTYNKKQKTKQTKTALFLIEQSKEHKQVC